MKQSVELKIPDTKASVFPNWITETRMNVTIKYLSSSPVNASWFLRFSLPVLKWYPSLDIYQIYKILVSHKT